MIDLLVVIADDFGIGPATDRGILELAAAGLVTGTTLLVNSPYAPATVAGTSQASTWSAGTSIMRATILEAKERPSTEPAFNVA